MIIMSQIGGMSAGAFMVYISAAVKYEDKDAEGNYGNISGNFV